MVEAIRQGDIPGVQLRCRQRLPAPPEEAWRWLTEPARLERWAAAEARVDLSKGGGLELAGRGEDGEPLRERGATVALVAPRRWRLRFERLEAGWPAATTLELEVTAAPGGCEVSVFQTGFEHLPLSECLTIWEGYRRRWRAALARLAAAAAGPSGGGSHPFG